MPERAPSLIRRQLAAELVRLRGPARISGRRMAKLLGVSQATLSRIDHGLGPVPSSRQIEIWLDATHASEQERNRIGALVSAAHNETTPWPELLAEHRGNLQDEAARLEADAIRLRNFQPTVIAGLLQTAAYTRALLPLADLTGGLDYEATLAGRVERQRVLYEPGRSFQFLIAEPVLSWSPGPAVMPGQRDRLAQLAELPGVEVAVLPLSAAAATPWHGFNLYERSDNTASVFLELIHRAELVTNPKDVQLYQSLWDRLWSASVTGADAITLIRSIR